MFVHVFFAVCLIALPSAWSYSSGAPSAACGNMTPQHGVPPQKSKAPYKLLLSTQQVTKGGEIELELKGDSADKTIKGFLVQARVGDQPVGQFKISDDDKYAQAVNCAGGNKNAATHKKIFGSGLSSVKLTWVAPPELSEEVKFYATVVLNGGIFWVNSVVEQVKVV